MTKDKTTEEFLAALDKSEELLAEMAFQKDVYIEKGSAYFISYKRKNIKVEFLFGPPQFEVDIITYISNEKYSFGDLLKILAILEWVNNNRYKQENGRNIHKEILWFIDLLKISLSILNK
ncbi:hypothetical protein BH10BAC2_BH10BAC2_11720 [soil metagenome]